MSGAAELRERICLPVGSLFDRGLGGGSSGNIPGPRALSEAQVQAVVEGLDVEWDA